MNLAHVAMPSETLADFLLKRIAEDEADWRAVDAREVVQMLHGKPIAPRMLAECEAKRRIVMAPTRAGVTEFSAGDLTSLEWIHKVLALPYADHPDYQQEWRP